MVAGVAVTNTRTKETVFTDNSGRYTIAADKKDEILFKKDGVLFKIKDKGEAFDISKYEEPSIQENGELNFDINVPENIDYVFFNYS